MRCAGWITLAAIGCGPPHLEATWTFEDISTGTVTGCPPNSTAELRLTPVTLEMTLSGSDYAARGPEIRDVFDCASGGGTSSELPSSVGSYEPVAYEVLLAIVDSGGMLYASSPAAYLDPETVDRYPVQILNDGGYFSVLWDVRRAGVQVSADWVRVTVTGSSASHSDLFAFAVGQLDGFGKHSVAGLGPAYPVTSGLPAGTYNVLIEALDAQMNAIGSVTIDNQTITTLNRVTWLPNAHITVTAPAP